MVSQVSEENLITRFCAEWARGRALVCGIPGLKIQTGGTRLTGQKGGKSGARLRSGLRGCRGGARLRSGLRGCRGGARRWPQ